MSVGDDKKIEILNDHYKDTCQIVREQVVIRDRLFLFVLIVLGVHCFQITDRDQSSQAMVSFLKEQAGFQITADINALNALLWFFLLATVVRYFQANIFINRQYVYLHDIENKLSDAFGQPLVSREGAHYLGKYPLFSKWTHILYTWAFPIFLLVVGTFKIVADWPGRARFFGPYAASISIYFMLATSVILYLIFLHRDNR